MIVGILVDRPHQVSPDCNFESQSLRVLFSDVSCLANQFGDVIFSVVNYYVFFIKFI